MSLIITKNGKNAKRVERASFSSEDELQQYIHENPESVPLYDIKEDVRVLILAREFPTESGPIDAVGVDKDGELYLIETKLYRNQDKRHVVAQVLDYGASLWRHYSDFTRFVATIEAKLQEKFGMGLHEKLQDFFGCDETETQGIVENMRGNLDGGVFKFVVLMDKLHGQLKDLILFLNQNSKFDLYAVEMEYYKHDEYEILIPRVFGAEVKKDVSVSTRAKARVWDKDSFFAELAEYTGSENVSSIMERIYDFAQKHGDIEYGNNSVKLKVTAKNGDYRTVFFITSKGKINLVSDFWKHNQDLRTKYAGKIADVFPTIQRERLLSQTYYEEPVQTFSEGLEKLLAVYAEMITDIA